METDAAKSHYGDGPWETDIGLFAEVAANSNQWLASAREHLNVASLLLPHVEARHKEILALMQRKISGRVRPSPDGAYFLHCAFAGENSFKAVLVHASREQLVRKIMDTGKLPKSLLGHNLPALAKKSGYPISLNDEHALRFLTRYGVWSGRYPLPQSDSEYAMTERHSDGQHYLVGGYNPEKVGEFLEIAARLCQWAEMSIGHSDSPGTR